MNSFAVIADHCPDSDLPVLRELLQYDMLCPSSCTFKRNHVNLLSFANDPSPLHWSRQMEWPWSIRSAELQRHHNVLDIGSGWSVLKFALAQRCASVQCLEPNAEFRAKAQQTINLIGMKNVQQIAGEAAALPFPADCFDRVFCVSVLEHIPTDHDKCVQEMVRVLKPGGALLLTMDVLHEGKMEGDFYFTPDAAMKVLLSLGIEQLHHGHILLGKIPGTNVAVYVVMARYVKPN